MPRVEDLSAHAFGLVTEPQRHVNALLKDYDPNLSLRRVQPTDPAFRADQPYGVWEDGLTSYMRNWVFFLSDAQIDYRVLARIVDNDMRKHGANEKMTRLLATEKAKAASQARLHLEQDEARLDEMQTIAQLAQRHTIVRARIGGELVRIGDEITSGRTHV